MIQLTNRQVGVLVSLSIISLKLFILPSLVSRYAGNNCYISVVFSMLIEFVFILLLLWIMKKNKGKSIFEILESKFGRIFPKILVGLLTIFFLGKSIVSMKELQNFLVQLLFEHITWWKFVIPLFGIVIYILNKSLRTFARSVQFFFWFLIVGASITLILPLQQIQLVNLLPIFNRGFLPIIEGSFFTSFHFVDFMVILIIMGRVKYTKETSKTIIKYSLITYVFILIYFIFYVGLFGNILVNEGLLVSDIPLYSNYPSTNGRLEWLSMIIWTMVLVYQSALMMICARECFSFTTSLKNNAIISIIISLIVAISLYLVYLNYAGIIKAITTAWFNSIILIFICVLVGCLIIASLGGKNETKIAKNC